MRRPARMLNGTPTAPAQRRAGDDARNAEMPGSESSSMSADTSPNDQRAPAEAAPLQRTPLYDEHRALGARLVEFSGWEMPVQYSGILEEHRAVRERAGLFDVSHMGEFRVEGPGALDYLQGL